MESIFTPEAYRAISYVMLGFAVLYVVFEVYLNLNDLEDDTSNVILLVASQNKFFFIPFALGAIMGHLFLGAETNVTGISSGWAVVVLFIIVSVFVGIGFLVPFTKTKIFLSLLLALGLAYGHFIWSQNFDETVICESSNEEYAKCSVEPIPMHIGILKSLKET